jgi:hypothetical protein
VNRGALSLVPGLLVGGAADATAIVITATDSGWYDDNGTHTNTNENYLVGWRGAEYHNFLVFDLTAIPITDTVVSATLRLFNIRQHGQHLAAPARGRDGSGAGQRRARVDRTGRAREPRRARSL